MDIEKIKKALKQKKWTYQDLANKSGVATITIKKILSGVAKYPRVDTVLLIEKALDIHTIKLSNLPNNAEEVICLLYNMTEKDIEKLKIFAEFIISKEKQ